MFHKISHVAALSDYTLRVRFAEGVTKQYDVKRLFEKYPQFEISEEEFSCVSVDAGGYGVVWNDELDISCDELWYNGTVVKTPFDGILAMSEATKLWGLNESTLRKAINYNKLVDGVDVCKYGKQWVIAADAMRRVYGDPESCAKA